MHTQRHAMGNDKDSCPDRRNEAEASTGRPSAQVG